MMAGMPAGEAPTSLGLLPDAVVAKYLSRGMRSGRELPPQVALRKASMPCGEDSGRGRAVAVRELVEEAVLRYDGRRTAADGWLAPRLHATLRMTRAEAADSRLWNFIAMIVAPDYVVWRHKGADSDEGDGTAAAARFSGPHHTQAFSRLWWAAELFRDGDDYRPVEVACQVQDVLNTTMRLDVIDHRPTAQALLKIVERALDTGARRPGDLVNALSSAVNAAGSTLVYDVLAPDTETDTDALLDWIADGAESAPVPWDRLPEGPDDGRVATSAVDALLPLFDKLLADAPLRRRAKRGEPGGTAARTGVSLQKPTDRPASAVPDPRNARAATVG
ncbi:DUF6339 family protein [Streptomyces sp. NPDC003090]|uniref:DUF6339 family protein n=1 Tax=Streptomyces sp. NPDC003090 TaxID=3154274 RepID=UPI00381E61EE